jgi:hypothetical protein
MTTSLEMWLQQATRRLSKDAAAQVRTEIREHYESAREAAISSGRAPEEASRLALAALGDPKIANADYLRVMLTSAEAKVLRQGNWEALVFCSYQWLKWMLTALPVATLIASAFFYMKGDTSLAKDLFLGTLVLTILVAGPVLPVYTPARSRVFRALKWVVYLGAFMVIAPWPWLLVSCLFPFAWAEWTRLSIRRKLPVAQWPKHLYL